jgi:hypothetical protein
MIPFTVYLTLFLFLIYKNNFFGLFKDDVISSKTFALLFFIKTLAIPAFYIVYKYMYGGYENFDAGHFFADSKALNKFAQTDFFYYIKVLVGFQNDEPGSYFYNECLVNTRNWDNGRIKDFFYNDNRIVIRVHSLLDFIAFNSYHVHALFSCFFSFIGLSFIYKSFKQFFSGREKSFLFITCLFPASWFYTGALLKEGITILVLGSSIILLKKLFVNKAKFINLILFIFVLFISFLLKPYVLLPAIICFGLFFILHDRFRFHTIIFFFVLIIAGLGANLVSLQLKNKNLYEVAFSRERTFASVAKGGIFLLDSVKFVRLNFDSTLIIKQNNNPAYYKIKLGSPYIYWEHTHQQDTLYCAKNIDTTTVYKLQYQLGKSNSNVMLNLQAKNLIEIILICTYYAYFHPLFFNATNMLQQLASLENLFIIFSLLFVLYGFIRSKKDKFIIFVFLSFALLVGFLVGLTTPNSGAIFRYRAPVAIFILLAALYYIDELKIFKHRR